MFNLVDMYKRQFHPHEDGYIFYPNRKGGGKFVTTAEYDAIMEQYASKFSWRPVAFMVFLFTFSNIVMIMLVGYLNLTQTIMYILLTFAIIILLGWTIWHSWAGHRMVKHKADIAPPRSWEQVQKDGRKSLGWPFILFLLFISIFIFIKAWIDPDRNILIWGQIVIFGVLIPVYLRMAYKKYRDEQS